MSLPNIHATQNGSRTYATSMVEEERFVRPKRNSTPALNHPYCKDSVHGKTTEFALMSDFSEKLARKRSQYLSPGRQRERSAKMLAARDCRAQT
jgi:hypothetical protein